MNDIRNIVRDTTTELLQQFEKQQKKALVAIQTGLCEMQIQATQVQISVGRGNATSRILVHGTLNVAKMVHSMDPQVVTPPDGALTAKTGANRATINAIKKVMVNLIVLPSESHHALLDGVIAKLWAPKKCALNVISERKVSDA